MPLAVGINYPWTNYDWDFGVPPVGAGGRPWGARAAWRARIVADLAGFRALGISVVRWWVLGSGLLYGTGAEAPRNSGGGWTLASVPQLSADIVSDFGSALPYFRSAGLRLIPVFSDFHMFLNPPASTAAGATFVKGGRYVLISDATKRPTFLANALQPLLSACRGFNDVIYAWDLINEPEWCVRNPGSGVPRGRAPTLDRAAMLAFLREGVRMINRAGFASSVGFASYNTIGAWNSIALDVQRHQFHYYPRGENLPRHTFDPRWPIVVGEFASAPHRPWPEIAALERSAPGDILHNRLRHIDSKGYPLALIWSAQDPPPPPDPGEPQVVDWSAAARAQVGRFTGAAP